MPGELGQNQSVTQAVVLPEAIFDHNTAPMLVSLFKKDGTPFLSDTAAVYSVASILWTPAAGLLQFLLTTPTANPYPYMTGVFNQTVPSYNGIYQNQTGAPGTVGNQPIKKIAELSEGEAVVFSSHLFEDLEDDLTPETMFENLKQGGFIATSTLVTGPDLVPEVATSLLYRGDRIQKIEDDLTLLASRVTALESP